MLKIKRDINQQDLNIVDFHLVKSLDIVDRVSQFYRHHYEISRVTGGIE